MKKIISILLSIIMVLSLVGCVNESENAQFQTSNIEKTTNDSQIFNVADAVYKGKIVTMDDKNTIAEAVAIKDGRILFVGTNEDVQKYVGTNTDIKDYGNNVIYPGFIDGHSHMGLVATMLVDGALLSDQYTFRQDAEIMKKFIEENPGKEVYKGFGFWTKDSDEDGPTHEVLDKYASDQVPIVIMGDGGHAALMNQKAIEYFKVKDLISVYGTDGIKVDDKGEPTGYLVETPRFDLLQQVPISKEELKEFFKVKQDDCLKQGFTCMTDAGIVETEKLPMVSAYKELADEGKLKLKIRALCELTETNNDPMKEVEKIAKLAESCDNEFFKITGIKIFLDGVVEGLTAWTLNPYTKEALKGDNYYGYIRWNDDRKEELTEIVKYANEKGLQVHMHAIGEGAADYALDCYAAAYKANPDIDARNAIAHLTYTTKDMPKRFFDNKVIAVVNPAWAGLKVTREGEIKVYGETEAKNMYKIKSFIDAGVVTSFHTDSSGKATEQIFSAATRDDAIAYKLGEDNSNYIRGLEECIDGKTSLKCLTVNPAYLVKEEKNLGSIEVGKAADFVIYDKDFTNENVVKDVSCTDAKIISSICNGKEIYSEAIDRSSQNDEKIIYRTPNEWKERYHIKEHGVNKELNDYDNSRPIAKCLNGTFVGNMEDDVAVWRGIPFAKAPINELRFAKAKDPDVSDKIYDATYFGDSCLQIDSEEETSSLYGQSEDCLKLNVWNNTTNKNKKKPVLVFIHGGGWAQGGTSDELQDGYNFVYYNDDIIFVTITYRFNLLGLINLSSFPDGDKYETSINNGLYDQVQALKWIHDNIEAFGGDSQNVTICGESAGGGAVSLLCLMKEARQYFTKAIPMSGSVNQGNIIDDTNKLPEALKKDFNVKTVADIQKVPFDELKKWWEENQNNVYHLCVRGGKAISEDPFKNWENGDTKDLIILQGHTTNEFQYYEHVFGDNKELYDAICEVGMNNHLETGSSEFKSVYNDYVKALYEYGYKKEDIAHEFCNDRSLAIGNTYQASEHAKNGGKGYFYLFEQSYDGDMAKYGAAHAVDLYYLFGNFNGNTAEGNKEEVDLSIKFQKMIANFCKIGNPSIEGLECKEYDIDNRYTIMIGKNLRVEKNPEKKRVEAALKMMDLHNDFRYLKSFSSVLPLVAEKHPELLKKKANVEADSIFLSACSIKTISNKNEEPATNETESILLNEIEEIRKEKRMKQLENLKNEDKTSNSVVYFIKDITPEAMVKIYDVLNSTLKDNEKLGTKVAVKLSTGEAGNTNYLKPELIADLVTKVNGTIVECNTAYGGKRSSTEEHMKVAEDHGFTKIAKVDIMDDKGEFSIPVNEKSEILEKDIVGINLKNYDSILCLSHFKGHQMGGFGGAIKNMSIGVASPNGKAYIHSAGKTEDVSNLWSNVKDQVGFEKAMAEAADSVRNYVNKRVIYINVMNNISIDCDCVSHPALPDMHDVGILASNDPVALDQACVDIVYNTDRKESQTLIDRIEKKQGHIQLDHSNDIGAGSKKYRLEVIDYDYVPINRR